MKEEEMIELLHRMTIVIQDEQCVALDSISLSSSRCRPETVTEEVAVGRQ